MAKTILRKLKINRVALCARGANPHADIVLFKSLDDPPSKGAKGMKGKIDRKKLTKAEIQKLDALLDKMGVETDEIAKFDSDDLPKADQKALAAIIAKAGPEDEDDDEQEDELEGVPAILKALKDNPKLAAEIKANKDLMKALGVSAKSEEDEDEDEDDDVEKEDDEDDEEEVAVDDKVLKSLPKAAQALMKSVLGGINAKLQKAREESKAAKDEAAAATKAAAIEKEARERAAFTATVAPMVKHLPGEVEKVGDMLFHIKKSCSDKQWAQLEKMLKAGNKAMGDLMEERGVDGEGDAIDKAEEQLDALAKEKAKADKISYQKAYFLVCEENPKLYEQYRKESGGKPLS